MLKCRWCGATGDPGTFDPSPDGLGYWCNTCDAFTYFNTDEENKHRLLLLLEQKIQSTPSQKFPQIIPPLKKQLSPLRYPGGKSKLIDYLYSKLVAEQLDTFVEVFAGGVSLGLALLDANVINHLVLNDIDLGVYALWETILNHPQELIKRLAGTPPTHQDLANAKEYLSQEKEPSALLAWNFLLQNRLSYSGIPFANPQGGKNGSQSDLLARWNPDALTRRIEKIHTMRNKIEVHHKDCCQFIEEDVWWRPKTTLFVDPPYFEKGPYLYRHSFTADDHRRLAELLQQLYQGYPDADVIITYDDHPFIRDLYPLARQEQIYRSYSI